MERSLASLTLGPQSGEAIFHDRDLGDVLLIDLTLFDFAVFADGIGIVSQRYLMKQ